MTNEELFAASAVHSWKLTVDRMDKQFAELSDEELQKEVAPGRNRVYYLLGHMAAVHDRMLPLLGLGERLHPELDEPFLDKADRAVPDTLSAGDLRKAWREVNDKLNAAIAALPAAEWLERHTAVSEEEFAKAPLRNRLSVLLSRTTHIGMHVAQIKLVKK